MKIAKLLAESLSKPWLIEPDNRRGMEWNNHIVTQEGHAICFMAHSGVADNLLHESSAELICALANSAEALVELVRVAEQCLDDFGETGHCVCPAAKEWLREALAALGEEWREEGE